MEQHGPRKLAVILHADVVGSTSLVQRDETLAHQRIQHAFQRFSETIKAYGGIAHEIRGDALVAEFERASDAVSAAIAFQVANSEFNASLSDEVQPSVRIGISLGEVVIADHTVTGAGVVLAQRLEQLANPDGVSIQGAAYETVPRRLPFRFESLGEQEVKGFDDPVRAYSVTLEPGHAVPAPERPTRRKSKWLAVAAIGLLIVAAGGLAWLQPWTPKEEPASVERMAFPLPDKPSIAVLPFDNLSGKSEEEHFADGVTNDIITDLSKFKILFVIASNSVFSYKGKAVKVQQVAEELGVRYVLEGSIQRTGERLRINAQLIDATKGHHLWGERYDRNASDFFAIQEEIVRTIVASLAFQIQAAEIERAVKRDTDNLEAYDYYQQGRKAFDIFTKEANNKAGKLYEKAIEHDPDFALAYSYLTWVHVYNWAYKWGEDPERSFDLALESARKATALDPDDHESHWALGFAYLQHGKFDRAEAEYERALALNSNDADLLVEMAELLVKTGKATQAVDQVKAGMRINPRYPDWYLWNLGWAQYFAEQYDEALTTLNRMSNPWNGVRRTLAAVYVRLGRLEDARKVMSKFIETDLEMTLKEMKAKSWKHQEYLDRWIDDLRTAGLPETRPPPLPDKPSIAVLPFTNMSDDPQQEYFADGITEDLITDLSKISGLFVIARNSSFAYKGKNTDVRQVARELGVKYVLEGSVRRAGDKVRINAQLVDATTGGHDWAERYDGDVSDVFALQDKVTGQVIAALAVVLSPEEQAGRSVSETQNPDAYDAFLRGWQHYLRRDPEHYAKARDYFESAIQLDAGYSRAYAAMASVYWRSWHEGWYPALRLDRDTIKARTREYLDTALRNPTSLAYQVAAYVHWWKGRFDQALENGQRAIDQDPNDADAHVTLAEILVFAGEPQRALKLIDEARRLDPHNQGYHAYLAGLAQFGVDDFDAAAASLERALELNPELWLPEREFGPQYCQPCVPLAAAYGHQGRRAEGLAQYRRLQESWFHFNVQDVMAQWWYQHEVDVDRLASGLLKIGLPASSADAPVR